MVSQLSLFEIVETGSFYKPGDWVKIRKVPKIAKHVKCGYVYQIHTVDPIDGRLQFWNPFAAQWDFLFPAEVKLALAPADKIDSVTPAEVAVTESKPELADSVTPAEVAVTESKPELADSVTPAEVAVTESTSEPAINYFSAVSAYRPRGTARGKEYYRLSYKSGGKVKHCHIRGGNTDSPIAQAKVQEVRSLLASGVSPAEVARWLRDSSSSV